MPFFQVNTFWEITKRQLEEKKAELRNKDREMEDSEERHQIEIKVFKLLQFELMRLSVDFLKRETSKPFTQFWHPIFS